MVAPATAGEQIAPVEAESYAAGDYPNQRKGGDGLVEWTEADRPIENTDVVLWYTLGHTHIPRPEDLRDFTAEGPRAHLST